MKIRFQADADLSGIIIRGVQRMEPRIDFRTAAEAGLRGLSDYEVLEMAARDGRILVSHDFASMPAAFAEFLRAHESPGVLIVPQGIAARFAIDDLAAIWAASEPEEWSNRIARLPL